MSSTTSHTETEYHPEHHVNEEPSNDFFDVAIGTAVTVGFFFFVSIIATVITIFIG